MKFTIPGRLIGLNEYILSCRSNKFKGGSSKRRQEKIISRAIKASKLKPISYYPVLVAISWYEKDLRRDADNVTFAKKFILDALVKEKILQDDSRKYVVKLKDDVEIDKLNPRIEVEILNV